MYSSSYLTTRSSADQGHVLRTIGGCGSYAAHRLAAEERYEAAATANARARFLRESEVEPIGMVARVTAFRSAVGSALIRIGECLHGRTATAAATVGRG
jgi:hypothetical protein